MCIKASSPRVMPVSMLPSSQPPPISSLPTHLGQSSPETPDKHPFVYLPDFALLPLVLAIPGSQRTLRHLLGRGKEPRGYHAPTTSLPRLQDNIHKYSPQHQHQHRHRHPQNHGRDKNNPRLGHRPTTCPGPKSHDCLHWMVEGHEPARRQGERVSRHYYPTYYRHLLTALPDSTRPPAEVTL
jgi:hypothetical protein